MELPRVGAANPVLATWTGDQQYSYLPRYLVATEEGSVWLIAENLNASGLSVGHVTNLSDQVLLEPVGDFWSEGLQAASGLDVSRFDAVPAVAAHNGVLVIASLDSEGRPALAMHTDAGQWETYAFPHEGLLFSGATVRFDGNQPVVSWLAQAAQNGNLEDARRTLSIGIAALTEDGEFHFSVSPELGMDRLQTHMVDVGESGFALQIESPDGWMVWRPDGIVSDWQAVDDGAQIEALQDGNGRVSIARRGGALCSPLTEHSRDVLAKGERSCLYEALLSAAEFQQLSLETSESLGSIYVSGHLEDFVSLRDGHGAWVWWVDALGYGQLSYRVAGADYVGPLRAMSWPSVDSGRGWQCDVVSEPFQGTRLPRVRGPGGSSVTLAAWDWQTSRVACVVEPTSGRWLVVASGLTERKRDPNADSRSFFPGLEPSGELTVSWGRRSQHLGNRTFEVPSLDAALVQSQQGILFHNRLVSIDGQLEVLPELPASIDGSAETPMWTGKSLYVEIDGVHWFYDENRDESWTRRPDVEAGWSEDWNQYDWVWRESGTTLLRVGLKGDSGGQTVAVQRHGQGLLTREVDQSVALGRMWWVVDASDSCLRVESLSAVGFSDGNLCATKAWARWR